MRYSYLLLTTIAFAPPAASQEASPEPAPVQAPAQAQPAAPVDAEEAIDEYGDEEAIVVTGARLPGSVVGDIPPERTFDARDVRATGATNINELLEALAPEIGSSRGRGGGRPIMLLNGKR